MVPGTFILPLVYSKLLSSLAAWGYVVAAARACDYGCLSSPGWDDFYQQQLRVIDWAKEQASRGDPVLSRANFKDGVGIAGHSMGGQATLFASSRSNASSHGIVAAVMLHAYTHEFPAAQIPFLAFMGTADTTAPPAMTETFFSAASVTGVARGIVNKINATHQEPTTYKDRTEPYNPLVPQFVAAWFKLYLNNVSSSRTVDWGSLIHGNGPESICGGGDGEMAQCEIVRGKRSQEW